MKRCICYAIRGVHLKSFAQILLLTMVFICSQRVFAVDTSAGQIINGIEAKIKSLAAIAGPGLSKTKRVNKEIKLIRTYLVALKKFPESNTKEVQTPLRAIIASENIKLLFKGNTIGVFTNLVTQLKEDMLKLWPESEVKAPSSLEGHVQEAMVPPSLLVTSPFIGKDMYFALTEKERLKQGGSQNATLQERNEFSAKYLDGLNDTVKSATQTVKMSSDHLDNEKAESDKLVADKKKALDKAESLFTEEVNKLRGQHEKLLEPLDEKEKMGNRTKVQKDNDAKKRRQLEENHEQHLTALAVRILTEPREEFERATRDGALRTEIAEDDIGEVIASLVNRVPESLRPSAAARKVPVAGGGNHYEVHTKALSMLEETNDWQAVKTDILKDLRQKRPSTSEEVEINDLDNLHDWLSQRVRVQKAKNMADNASDFNAPDKDEIFASEKNIVDFFEGWFSVLEYFSGEMDTDQFVNWVSLIALAREEFKFKTMRQTIPNADKWQTVYTFWKERFDEEHHRMTDRYKSVKLAFTKGVCFDNFDLVNLLAWDPVLGQFQDESGLVAGIIEYKPVDGETQTAWIKRWEELNQNWENIYPDAHGWHSELAKNFKSMADNKKKLSNEIRRKHGQSWLEKELTLAHDSTWFGFLGAQLASDEDGALEQKYIAHLLSDLDSRTDKLCNLKYKSRGDDNRYLVAVNYFFDVLNVIRAKFADGELRCKNRNVKTMYQRYFSELENGFCALLGGIKPQWYSNMVSFANPKNSDALTVANERFRAGLYNGNLDWFVGTYNLLGIEALSSKCREEKYVQNVEEWCNLVNKIKDGDLVMADGKTFALPVSADIPCDEKNLHFPIEYFAGMESPLQDSCVSSGVCIALNFNFVNQQVTSGHFKKYGAKKQTLARNGNGLDKSYKEELNAICEFLSQEDVQWKTISVSLSNESVATIVRHGFSPDAKLWVYFCQNDVSSHVELEEAFKILKGESQGYEFLVSAGSNGLSMYLSDLDQSFPFALEDLAKTRDKEQDKIRQERQERLKRKK